jgi:hypothetical protein
LAPFFNRSSAFLISSSMTALKRSIGCAPDRKRPLMKNAGVPRAPTAASCA